MQTNIIHNNNECYTENLNHSNQLQLPLSQAATTIEEW